MEPHARARWLPWQARSLVQGDSDLPPTFGPRKGEIETAHPPSQGGTSVEIVVGSNLACSDARTFAASLLNLKLGGGADGNAPSRTK